MIIKLVTRAHQVASRHLLWEVQKVLREMQVFYHLDGKVLLLSYYPVLCWGKCRGQ
jgi:hypothetical protein